MSIACRFCWRAVLLAACVLSFGHLRRLAAQESAPAATDAPAMEAAEPLLAPGMLTLGAAGGEDFFEGRLDLLLPLLAAGDGRGLLLGDLRGVWGDEGEQEFNAGLVCRHYLSRIDAILGVNAFYDSRWTGDDNQFNQLGLGAEILTEWLDARANIYLPENERELVDHSEETLLIGTSSRTSYRDYAVNNQIREKATTVRTSRFRTDVVDVYETPREGWDAEVGVKLPLPREVQDLEARLFVGYYDFEPKWKGNVPSDNDVSGPKARFELRAWNCLFLDAEWFEDENLYGSDYLLGARLRLPLGSQEFKALTQGDAYAWRGGGDGPLTVPQRMTEMVMRDPRIQLRNESQLTQTFSAKSERFTSDYLLLDDVIFVYGDNLGDPLESGSAEHPFDVIQEGVDRSAAIDYPNVYVFGASSPYRENVLIQESINLHGEGCRVGKGSPPTRGFGRPVVEGQAGLAMITPAVLEIKNADSVRVAGFEFTAAPFAGGPWTSPYDGGKLSPLSGIYAHDVRALTVQCNHFRNLVAGVVATYGPVSDFELAVVDNSFNNVGLGIGALFDVGGRALIAGNDIQDSLIGIAVAGYDMSGRAEVDVLGNRIAGRTADLAGIEPFELFADFFDNVLPPVPGFPADHPAQLPFPALGGIVVVAAPGANIGARVMGNVVQHPFIGIAGLALGLGPDPTVLDLAVVDNELVGGGLDAVYQLGRAHAGTIAALISGNYGTWDQAQTELVGDAVRNALPSSLGFDAGLLGIGAVAVGDNAVMDNTLIGDNRVDNYLVGIGAVSALGASMNDAVVARNELRSNLAGILGIAAVNADMAGLAIADNRVVGAPGIGALNPMLDALQLSLFGPDPIQLPEIGLAGIGLIGISGADIDGYAITGNRVDDYLLGIGVVGVNVSMDSGAIAGNRVEDALLGVLGLGIGSSMRNTEIAGNMVMGSGVVPLVGMLAADPGALPDGDAGLLGIGLIGVGSDLTGLDIRDNVIRDEALGLAFAGIDSAMPGARIANNNVAGCLVGILGLAVDSQMDGLRIEGNTVRGAGLSGTLDLVAAVAPGLLPPAVVALDLPDWGALGIGLIGVDSDLTGLDIRDNVIRNEALGLAFVGVNSAMPGARIANNNVAGCLAGILGLAVNSQMDGLRIEGNTVRGAGLPGTLDLVAAVAPGLLPPAVVALDLPDWGALGIGLVGIGGGTSVDGFVINDNRLDRHLAGILVAGIGGASMQNGTIADNYSSQHLLGIVALSLGANLGGLDIEDNTLTGFGPDILILP